MTREREGEGERGGERERERQRQNADIRTWLNTEENKTKQTKTYKENRK